MDTIELFQRVGLALAIGIVVGIERGWQERAGPAGSRVAGIRTYALIGLLGGISAALVPFAGQIAFGLIAFGFSLGLLAFQWRMSVNENTVSATDFIAGVLTYALGAFAVMGEMAIASAAAVATTTLLAFRAPLHTFVERLRWEELRAALLLLAMTFVLLPLLPDRTVDPWNALNPHQLWLMTILVAVFSYAGYIAIRLAGERQGLLFAAALGALVSSTAVTMSYGRLVALHKDAKPEASLGIIVAWIVSLIRMSALGLVLAPVLLKSLLPPLLAAVFVLAAVAIWLFRRSQAASAAPKLGFTNPFEIGEVLRFGALLAVVLVAAKMLSARAGEWGLLPLAAVSGIVDVDPITVTAARSATAANAFEMASLIVVAGGSNLVSKMIIGTIVSGFRLGAWLGLAGGLAILAAVTALYVAA